MLTFLSGFVIIAFTHYLYSRPLYRNLPASIVESLLRSPLEYFMAAPSAKIIRVLSSDLRVNDRVLGQCLLRLLLFFCAYMSNQRLRHYRCGHSNEKFLHFNQPNGLPARPRLHLCQVLNGSTKIWWDSA